MMFLSLRHGLLRKIVRAELIDDGTPLYGSPCIISGPEGRIWARSLGPASPQGPGPLVTARLARPDDHKAFDAASREAQADLALARQLTAELPGLRLLAAERLLDQARGTIIYETQSTWPWADFTAQLREQRAVEVRWHQVGARGRAALCGGLGSCGRELCCSTLPQELAPVTMAMARGQSRSLDPEDTAGACGRLKCCLRYEYEVPPKVQIGDRIRSKRISGRVVAILEPERSVLVETDRGARRPLFLRELEK
jgi:hypothetical protein